MNITSNFGLNFWICFLLTNFKIIGLKYLLLLVNSIFHTTIMIKYFYQFH